MHTRWRCKGDGWSLQHAIWLLLARRKHFALSPQAKAGGAKNDVASRCVTDPAANANNLPQLPSLSHSLSLSDSLALFHSICASPSPAQRNCGKAAGNQQAFMDATTLAASASPDELVDDDLLLGV